jgi:hypothetical protein
MLTNFSPAAGSKSGAAIARRSIMSPQLDERAARVKVIAEMLHGSVLSREGDAMTVEVPDCLGGVLGLLGQGGFIFNVGRQTTKMARCSEEVTTAFMGVNIDLAPRDAKVETMSHSAAGHRGDAADKRQEDDTTT